MQNPRPLTTATVTMPGDAGREPVIPPALMNELMELTRQVGARSLKVDCGHIAVPRMPAWHRERDCAAQYLALHERELAELIWRCYSAEERICVEIMCIALARWS